jgi:signal transduction histidine kinase
VYYAVKAFVYLNLVAYVVLAAVTIWQWTVRRSRSALWVALAFGALAFVVMLSQVVPDHPHDFWTKALVRIEIAVLLTFPYLLFRFSRAFGRAAPALEGFVAGMTTLLVVWTFALPHFPERGEARSAAFDAYLVAFLFHWTVLSVVVAMRLWHAGRRQPTVSRRRMRLLATAAAGITLALILSASTSSTRSPLALAAQIAAFASAVGFLLGLAPPMLVRLVWRLPEQQRLQQAIGSLMALAQDEEEIAARVLEPMVDIVGARAIAIYNSRGSIVGSHGAPDDSAPIDIAMPDGGRVCVWTTPYAPYFGGEELALLRTLGALTGLALDRARLFAREHQTRLALEEADELKSSFVALAAHELRAPATTIYGFAETLDRLDQRLDPERRAQLRSSLANEARRLTMLVEQLLDLSMLDAHAIEIVPQRFNVRARVVDLLPLAAGGRAAEIELAVSEELETTVDPQAFDRIVSNLITNALRYGEAPVSVRAERSDRHFRIAVEDRGPGVPPEFESELFERFTRSRSSRERAAGTGLGLAIARSYALAHRGDLLYEPAEPRGARFQLVLPLQPEEFEVHGVWSRDSRLPPAGTTLP